MDSNLNALVLRGREEVINKAIEMISETKNRLFGQGEDLDWIEDGQLGEKFAQILRSTLTDKNITLQLISHGKGMRALDVAKKLENVRPKQVEVYFKKYGETRVLVSDDHRILLAFRRGSTLGKQVEDYTGLYLENRSLANWLAERQRRLIRAEDARPLEDDLHILANYGFKNENIEALEGREATILKAIELISNATASVLIAGQQIDWIIEDGDIGHRLEEAIHTAKESNKLETVKILAGRATKKAITAAKIYRKGKVDVRLHKNHGQTRIVIIDGKHVIIAFPQKPLPPEKRNRDEKVEYIAFYACNKRLANWLSERFEYLWDSGKDFGLTITEKIESFKLKTFLENVAEEIKHNAAQALGYTLFLILGYLLSEIGRIIGLIK